jgi:hypothetical protein
MQCPSSRDGKIVEDAVPGTLLAKGVVRAAGDSSGTARFESAFRGGECSSGTRESSGHETGRSGKANAPQHCVIERCIEKAIDIFRSVDAKQIFSCGERCFEELEAGMRLQQVTHHAVFRNRETVLLW